MTAFTDISSKIDDLFGYSPNQAQILQRPDLLSIALDAIAANVMNLTQISTAINTLMGTAYTNDELKQRPDLLRLGIMAIAADADSAIADGSITTAKYADNSVTTAKIPDANITASKLSGGQTGTAPIFGLRAWVNFNGTGTVAIRASGNVSSITDDGTGVYTVNFTNALPNANYGVAGLSELITLAGDAVVARTTTTFKFSTVNSAIVATDAAFISLFFVG